MTSSSSASTSPSALTPESTGAGQSSPDTSVSSSSSLKKSRRQTAFYPNINSSTKTQKPFSRSAAKRESVMALGSIEHLQYYFTKTGIKSKKKPLDKPHYGLVPAIGSSAHNPGNGSITSISDLLELPPTPVIPESRLESVFTGPHVKSAETDPETLLPGVVEDLAKVEREWGLDGEAQDDPIDVLDVLQTTTRAVRTTRNYLLSQPDEFGGIIREREHFRSSRLGPGPIKGDKDKSGPVTGGGGGEGGRTDPLSLIRRSALEVLSVLRELEEKTRLPLTDDAYDAQSDGGGSSLPVDDEQLLSSPGVHQVDGDTSVAFSLMKVNGRFGIENVPVWEDPDADDPFSNVDGEEKEKRDRWDERLVLGSGWLYQQDVNLAQLERERKLVREYLDVVDQVLFEGKKGARGEQRGWQREIKRLRDRERSRSRAGANKRRVSAGDVEGGIGLSVGPFPAGARRVSTGMLPDIMGRMNIIDEPKQMEGISEEGEGESQAPEEEGEEEDDDGGFENDALPEWAKRFAFMDSELDRAHALLQILLPPNLQPHLSPTPPSTSPTARTTFLESLASGQLLCVAYNTGVRKSKKPWGYINIDGVHDIFQLVTDEAEKREKDGDSKNSKSGWTFRRSDNLRLWVGALKLRYLLPILVPSQTHNLSAPKASSTPNASNSAASTPIASPLTSPLPLGQRFSDSEPPVMFDARIVAKQEEGWEEMLETVLKRWMWRVVDEKRGEK